MQKIYIYFFFRKVVGSFVPRRRPCLRSSAQEWKGKHTERRAGGEVVKGWGSVKKKLFAVFYRLIAEKLFAVCCQQIAKKRFAANQNIK